MISKTKISKRTIKKTNPELVKTINLAKKNNHLGLAKILAGPTRQQIKINLTELNELNEKNIIVPGKVLGSGEIKKKLNISALSFSEQAEEKLKKQGCDIKTILRELENNPKLTGVKILQNY
jgi:large subunit ribosomal protein L18e